MTKTWRDYLKDDERAEVVMLASNADELRHYLRVAERTKDTIRRRCVARMRKEMGK